MIVVFVIFVLLQLVLSCYSDFLCLLFNEKQCFLVFDMSQCSYSFLGVLKRMDWLLDLMGYIRNVAYKSTPLQNVDLKEVMAVKIIWSKDRRKF